MIPAREVAASDDIQPYWCRGAQRSISAGPDGFTDAREAPSLGSAEAMRLIDDDLSAFLHKPAAVSYYFALLS